MINFNRTYTNPTIIKPQGVIIHSIGVNQPNKDVIFKNMNTLSASVSVHAICDMSGTIQLLPYNYKAWHCGKSGNNTHLSIEQTEPRCLIYKDNRVVDYDVELGYLHWFPTKNNCVKWTVERCIEYNIDVKNVISHSEGYKLGIASNHGDPEHWWQFHNYTMDDFRQEVYEGMHQQTRYQSFDQLPEWTRPYIKILMDKKYLNELDLTMDMIRVMIVSGRIAGLFN